MVIQIGYQADQFQTEGNMASSRVSGSNIALIDGVVNFLGYKGGMIDGDPYINYVGSKLYDTPVMPCDRDSLLPEIRDLIANDEATGRAGMFAMLLLGPRQAVAFFLEGVITPQHIAAATEAGDYVDLPNVDVDGHAVTVRVMNDPELTIATADAAGNII